MSSRTLNLNDRLYRYLQGISLREPDVLRRLREETARLPMAVMQISPEQGQFMAFLVRAIGARRCLEVGTFTGYSALACALALPPDGQLVALDISEEWTRVARRYWDEAGMGGRIHFQLGPAGESLRRLRSEGRDASFDFIFIDADKQGYADYVEQAFHLARAGGLIAIDNVLWSGLVADPDVSDPDTAALRKLNASLQADRRFDLSMVPIGDGLTLLRKLMN